MDEGMKGTQTNAWDTLDNFQILTAFKAQNTLHDFSNHITVCHTVRHGSNKLGYDVCADCTMMTAIDSYDSTHVSIEEFFKSFIFVFYSMR